MRKKKPEGAEAECFLCDSVMAVLGGLVGLVLIGISIDLLTRGTLSGRIENAVRPSAVVADAE